MATEHLHWLMGKWGNSGFHGNRKLPLAYNGENDVSTFSRLFLIRSFLYLQVTRPVLIKFLFVASLGWGKGCIRFWGRLDQNSGFHGNRKLPLAYNEENGVSTFSWLLLIRSFLYLLVTRTCIKSRTSLNFGQIGLLTVELAALEHLKNCP